MKRVVGIGGIFFKGKDHAALREWYAKHLGIATGADGASSFEWRDAEHPDEKGMTVWSIFNGSTTYFEPSKSAFMVNYIVEDLDAVLAALRAEGVAVDDKVEDYDYGRFGWAMDPEGNRFELWQPPKTMKN